MSSTAAALHLTAFNHRLNGVTSSTCGWKYVSSFSTRKYQMQVLYKYEIPISRLFKTILQFEMDSFYNLQIRTINSHTLKTRHAKIVVTKTSLILRAYSWQRKHQPPNYSVHDALSPSAGPSSTWSSVPLSCTAKFPRDRCFLSSLTDTYISRVCTHNQ